MKSLLLEKCGNEILIKKKKVKEFTVLCEGGGLPFADKVSTFVIPFYVRDTLH